MAKARLNTILKLGNFEVKRRTKLADIPVKKTAKVSRGPVVGISGNAPSYGNMATGEYLSKLEGPKGRAVYDEMRRSDPQVQSTLKAIKLSIRQADYFPQQRTWRGSIKWYFAAVSGKASTSSPRPR